MKTWSIQDTNEEQLVEDQRNTWHSIFSKKKNLSFISQVLWSFTPFHSTSFHFISLHFTPLHFISSISLIKIFFMTISIWSFVICSFPFIQVIAVSVSAADICFHSWLQFLQPEVDSTATTLFSKECTVRCYFHNHEIKCRWEDKKWRPGAFKTPMEINQLKTKGKGKDSKGMNKIYFK